MRTSSQLARPPAASRISGESKSRPWSVKGTTGIVLEASAPEDRLAMTSALLIALFVGLSLPVIGAGIALRQGASAPNTVLVFAVLVGAGVALAGLELVGRGLKPAKAKGVAQ